MAGFWTGLVHGTLLCGATLAAMSLAFPRAAPELADDLRGAQPAGSDAAVFAEAGVGGDVAEAPPTADHGSPAGHEDATDGRIAAKSDATADDDRVSEDGAVPDSNTAADGDMPALDSTQAAARVPAPEPAAQTPIAALPDPVGSEYLRGVDLPPVAPADSSAPTPLPPPRSGADVGGIESLPAPSAPPGERPAETAPPHSPALLSADPAEPASVAAQPRAGAAAPVPGRLIAPDPDQLLDRSIAAAAQDAAEPAEPAPSVAAMEPTASPETGDAAETARGIADIDAAAEPDTGGDDDDDAPPSALPAAGNAPPASRAPRPAPDLSLPDPLSAPGAVPVSPNRRPTP